MRDKLKAQNKIVGVLGVVEDNLDDLRELFEDFVYERYSEFQELISRTFYLRRKIKDDIRNGIAREWDEEGL